MGSNRTLPVRSRCGNVCAPSLGTCLALELWRTPAAAGRVLLESPLELYLAFCERLVVAFPLEVQPLRVAALLLRLQPHCIHAVDVMPLRQPVIVRVALRLTVAPRLLSGSHSGQMDSR